jgi:hypothetical protein
MNRIGEVIALGFLVWSLIATVSVIRANMAVIRGRNVESITASILRKSRPTDRIVLVVPLKGAPSSTSHGSYISARIAYQIAQSLAPQRQVVIMLSGGFTGPGRSEAAATAALFGWNEGTLQGNIDLMFEQLSVTTRQNMIYVGSRLGDRYRSNQLYTVVVSNAEFPFGHAQRAMMQPLGWFWWADAVVPAQVLAPRGTYRDSMVVSTVASVLQAYGLSIVLDWVIKSRIARHGRR